MATDFTAQITAWYQAVQYRNPPATDLAVYNAALNSGVLTAATVQQGIENDPYTINLVNAVIREYQAAFGRVPDQAGASFWTAQLFTQYGSSAPLTVAALNALATTFANSAEFNARFGATATTVATPSTVQALYTNVLGRAPDAAGLAYWSNSGLSVSALLSNFSQSPEFIAATNPAILGFQTAELAGTLATNGSLFQFGGSQNPGSTYVFTTAVDILTGTSGADVFIADNTAGPGKYTFTAADTVNGNGGSDTLKIYSDSTTAALGYTAVNIKGISSLYINNIGANTVDATLITGLTAVTIDNPGNTPTVNTAGQAVTFSNDATGGYTLNITSKTDTTENLTFSSVAVSTGHDVVDSKGALVTSETVTSTGPSTNYVDLKNTGGAITSVTITGAAALTSKFDSGLDATIKTVNASAATGKVSIDLSAASLVNTAFSFTGGTANDTLTLYKGDLGIINSGTQLDGGAGTNTLAINDTTLTAANYTFLNATKNFQVLQFNTTGATLDDSLVTAAFANHFAMNDTGGTNIINNIVNNATVDLLKSTTSDTFSPAVGANTLTLNIGTSTNTSSITATKEIVTGESTVNVNALGSAAETVTAFVNSDNTSFVIKGTAALTVTAVAVATLTGDKIDASGLTGSFTLSADSGKGDLILTGSGVTSLTETSTANADNFIYLSGHTNAVTLNISAQYTATDKITYFALGQDVIAGGGLKAGGELGATAGVVLQSNYSNAPAFIAAAQALSTGTAKDVIFWYDATNNNTYVAEFGAAAVNSAHIIELVGTHATSIGTSVATGAIVIS